MYALALLHHYNRHLPSSTSRRAAHLQPLKVTEMNRYRHRIRSQIAIDRLRKRGEWSRNFTQSNQRLIELHTPLLYLHRHLSSKTPPRSANIPINKSSINAINGRTDACRFNDPSLMKLPALIVRANFESSNLTN